MKIGFVGPAHGDLARLRSLCERLLFDLVVDRVYHLGADDSLDRAMIGWSASLGAPRDDEALLDEVALLAPDASPEVLDAVLAREAMRARLSDVASITSASGRQIEMVEDRVILVMHDRAVDDDDDLANALLVVDGSVSRPDLRVVGGRGILMPGGASRGGHVGVVEQVEEGLRAAILDGLGQLVREATLPLHGKARMEILS